MHAYWQAVMTSLHEDIMGGRGFSHIPMVLKTGTEKEPEKKLISGFLVEPVMS